MEDAVEVEVDVASPPLGIHLPEGSDLHVDGNARVVHQHVDGAERLLGSLDTGGDGPRVGHVEGHRDGAAPRSRDVLRRRLGAILEEVVDRDGGPLPGEQPRDARPRVLPGTRHQRHSA